MEKQALELHAGPEIGITFKGPANFDNCLHLLLSVLITVMNVPCDKAKMDGADEKDIFKLKEHIYDQVNVGASRVLELFAPEIEMRPDLTAEAILEKENEILRRQVENEGIKEDFERLKTLVKELGEADNESGEFPIIQPELVPEEEAQEPAEPTEPAGFEQAVLEAIAKDD